LLTGWAVVALVALSLSACGSFVTVKRVPAETVGRELSANALTGDRLSTPTRNVLLEHGLLEAFDADPAGTLGRLHKAMVAEDGDFEDLFALAELAFRQAQEAKDLTRYLEAVVYAYAFLFAEGHGQSPGRFDPRLRMAADLYNRALTLALANPDGSEVTPRSGRFALSFGVLDIDMDPDALRVGAYAFDRFTPVADLEVEGLNMRYRRAGLGAPLAASLKPADPDKAPQDFLPAEMNLAVTMLLRITDPRRTLVEGGLLVGRLDVFLAAEPESITIGGERVPSGGRAYRRARLHALPDAHPRARDQALRRAHHAGALGRNPRHDRALPARPHPRGVHPRHLLERVPLGGDGEPPRG
jgi:hypothetical protein